MNTIYVFPTSKNYDNKNWNEEIRKNLMEMLNNEEFINQLKVSKKEKLYIKGNWYTYYYTD